MNQQNNTILAIESSCDDTSVALIVNGIVKSNIVSSQLMHKLYNGVVPEVASRAHQANILPVIQEALDLANVEKKSLDAVAFTRGPGLMGSLLVGVAVAKSMALALNIPLIEVNHMQAHILAHFIEDPKPDFPFLCLTVSGGHTQIVRVNAYNDMQILGETIDDAAGEAFDKSGKMLGLGYPAGPLIDKFSKEGNPVFTFAKPKVDGYNYSFSGLKTSILYFLQKQVKLNPHFVKENLADLCCSVQSTILEILFIQLIKVSKDTGIKKIAIAGGVSANSGLRSQLQAYSEKYKWEIFIPKFEYCTDNAAMIAMTAYFKFLDNDFSDQSVGPLVKVDF
jgi:N6-L-threonylcarbamoyladenine synthase